LVSARALGIGNFSRLGLDKKLKKRKKGVGQGIILTASETYEDYE